MIDIFDNDLICVKVRMIENVPIMPEDADRVGDMIEEIVITADENRIRDNITVTVTADQLEAVQRYLSDDAELAIRLLGNWVLDSGKLQRAFELAGIGVTGDPSPGPRSDARA